MAEQSPTFMFPYYIWPHQSYIRAQYFFEHVSYTMVSEILKIEEKDLKSYIFYIEMRLSVEKSLNIILLSVFSAV